jgi:peptidoglycan hydrolase-like protein with peptidoglycan-binding domain
LAYLPYIPETITVHLGAPNSDAQNVTLSFPDYIKNVASSEIYPTWPENALRANIYAQISLALNRVYTEWYRSRGYDFDITSSTQYDQKFIPNREIFENISRIVDEIFNQYITRGESIAPLFTSYCDGSKVTCEGLSQWGTVTLANEGRTPFEILQYYYGNDIRLNSADVRPIDESYPGVPLRLGSAGNDVRRLQIKLNRISRNYPAIPKIDPVDGVFAVETENAVRTFQSVFNLAQDGIVGKATWYRINYIYNSVKKLSELGSEGLLIEDTAAQFPNVLRPGDSGENVRLLQYFLKVIGTFYDAVPEIKVDGIYGELTANAVRAFQRAFGLAEDGIVGEQTWQDIYRAYLGIEQTTVFEGGVKLYPGVPLRIGSKGEDVSTLQTYLSRISDTYTNIPKIPVTGNFGQQTYNAVVAFQQTFGLTPDGSVDALTWDAIASLYSDLTVGNERRFGQYPGSTLQEV